jgi:A/G-specific adenine glycosylase
MRRVSLIAIPPKELRILQRRTLSWFARCKRDLPWRRTQDPYRIWISEIMLQQTRVAAVIPYYERFLASFPDVQALARAKPERVLANWAGLGYYSRARNLHRAAKEIVACHAGAFPNNYDAALKLPGIGAYTAAAVLSIAYSRPHAVLDGNVARVLVRIAGARGNPRKPAVWRELQRSAQNLLSIDMPGDWNQAMMELGATICTPQSPACSDCPVRRWCRARSLGIAEQLPGPREKTAPVEVVLAAAVLLDPRGRTLLVRTTAEEGALFSRMWQFPAVQSKSESASATAVAKHVRSTLGIAFRGKPIRLPAARHTVTFRKVRLQPFLMRIERLARAPRTRIVPLDGLGEIPVSSATRKIAAAALTANTSGTTTPERARNTIAH